MGLKTLQTFDHVHVQVGRNIIWSRVSPKQPAHIYTVWYNFEAYYPRQQAKNFQSMDFEYFRRTEPIGSFGFKSNRRPVQSTFY